MNEFPEPQRDRHGGAARAVVAAVVTMAAALLVACTPSGPSTPGRPTGTIAIVDGTRAVSTLTVDLAFTTSADVTDMRVSDGADPTSDAWIDVADTVTWDLPDTGQGARVISAQFRSATGAVSEVVRTEVIYDTIAPVIAVTSPVDGATVDVSRGELAQMVGTTTDSGSGTADVTIAAPDGTPIPAELGAGETWTGLISAPVSGVHPFKVTATDEAGNSATAPISLSITAMPPTDGTVIRPTTWNLNATEQGSVASVEPDSITIAGDHRAALQGRTTLLSAPIAGEAADGLLRNITSVSYDAVRGNTEVSTSDGSLPDAFAQFELDSAAPGTPAGSEMPAISSSAPAITSGPCSNFVSGRSITYSRTGSWRMGRSGEALGVEAVASIGADVDLVAFADVDLRLQMGWSPKVTGSVSAGAMACGEVSASASAQFDRTFSLPGGELRSCWLVGPIPVCLTTDTGLRVHANVDGPKLSVTANAGFQATFPVDGSPSFSFPRDISAAAQAYGSGSLFVAPSMDMKLVAAEAVESKLLGFSGGPIVEFDTARRTAQACVKLSAAFKPSLKVKIPFTGRSFTVFEKNFEESMTGLCRQIWPAPTTGGGTGPDGPGTGPVDPGPGTVPAGSLVGKIGRAPDGTSWYVDKRGGTHWIPDGGTYQCLAGQGVPVVAVQRDQIVKLPNYEDAECVRANSGDVIRHDDGDAYLLEPGGVRRWIRDGGTYQCLTINGHRVVNGVPRYYIDDLSKGADYSWSCWDANAARGKVVRADDGSSWYVDLRGGRHWIPDGGTFECIAAQRGAYAHTVMRAAVDGLPQYENAQCVRANPGNIIRHNDGDSYLVEGNWSRRWIADGNTFLCLQANGHGVVNGVPRYYIDDLSKGADYSWSCWDANAARGKVVRADDGSSWYVDLRGGRHWIPDGGTFECIAAQRGVHGTVIPRGLVNSMPQYENAQCVRVNPGDIIRHNDGDAYVLQANWTRRWIPTSASYNCERARNRRIVSGLPRYYIDDLGSGPNLSNWDSCRLILAHTAGDSHFIDGSGLRHWIPNTATYSCLSSRYPRFNTSDRGLVDQGWTEKEWATCSM